MIRCVSHEPEALSRLEVAFRACPNDFKELKAEVEAGRVSLYELSGEGYCMTVAGEVIGETYFLWGVSGHGVVPAIRELSQYVKNAGLQHISAETYFPALARLVSKLNTTERALTETTHLSMRV
ncbi:DNAase [Vibrio fluvialis]|uniref:DNAase n=1 Tax=Vibrio fluvialis TaxID=676 RepID=UPI00192B6A9F|nr:DNAase [Vibrio fluvialis]MBL4261745.1 DNAase [Vibrio fluvialis]MBY7973833.1 DNAase [Vibrio fluvialis]